MRGRTIPAVAGLILVISFACILFTRKIPLSSGIAPKAGGPPPKLPPLNPPGARAQETDQNQDWKSKPASEKERLFAEFGLKKRDAVSMAEATKFVGQTAHSAPSMAWAFCHTGHLDILNQALAAYPEDGLLNFLAAVSSKLVDPKERDAVGEIPAFALRALEGSYPGFDAMAKLVLGTPLGAEDLQKLSAAAPELMRLDDILQKQDIAFLQSVRGFDQKGAYMNSIGAGPGVVHTLGTQTTPGSEQTPLAAVARTILADASDVDAAVVGKMEEVLFSRKLNDETAQALYGVTADAFRQEVLQKQADLKPLLMGLRSFEKTASETEFPLFIQAKGEIGEMAAVQQLIVRDPQLPERGARH